MWIVFNKTTNLYFENFQRSHKRGTAKAVIWTPRRHFAKRLQSKIKATYLAKKLNADVQYFRDTERQALSIPRKDRCWSFVVRYRVTDKHGKLITGEVSDSIACKKRGETRKYMRACAAGLVQQQGAEILSMKSYPIADPKSQAGLEASVIQDSVEQVTVESAARDAANKIKQPPKAKRKKFKAALLVPKKEKTVAKHKKVARKIELADAKQARIQKALATLRKGSKVTLYADFKTKQPRQAGIIVSKSKGGYVVQTDTALRTVTISGIRI